MAERRSAGCGMKGQRRNWHPFPNEDALISSLLVRIRTMSTEAIRERGAFHLVLAGGTTPRRFYAQMKAEPMDWPNWHIWFGDERCLPVGDAERNDTMASVAWLDHVAIPQEQVHAIPAESGADAAAKGYSQSLSEQGDFDLVLLGLGEDGHTASLFPGQEWGGASDAPPAIAVFDAPKPPPERVSLSANRLSQARQVWFIVTGASKIPAMKSWKADDEIPANAIVPALAVDIFTDRPDS